MPSNIGPRSKTGERLAYFAGYRMMKPSVNNKSEAAISKVKSSPKDVFLHALLIVTLYMSVVSFIMLCFQYVNILFPDPLTYSPRSSFDGIRWGSSVLLVALPVFLWLSWLLEKEFHVQPARRELKIRKWLVYLTLFIAAITIIVDLIVLIYNFYGGEMTVQFALKILVVLAVAAAVFSYYLWDLRKRGERTNIPKIFAWTAGAIGLAALIAGFFIGGSPAYQRQIRFDDQRVQHLQMLQGQIVYYWSQKDTLPARLEDLQDSISGFVVPTDPATGASYEYTVKDDLMFELCATFAQKGGQEYAGLLRPAAENVPVKDPYLENWQHEAGHACFERTIDPELHKQNR